MEFEPKSPDSDSASASCILLYLTELDIHSEDFSSTLNSVLRSDEFPAFVSELDDRELIVLIDFLDQALDTILTDPDIYRRCLRSLRKICGLTLQLPSSHLISDGLVKTSNSAVATGGFADVYVGSYREREVAIKRLRIYTTDDVAEIKKTFCKEVIIWKRLSHQHVLPFLGVFTSITGSELCMVSEWMVHGNIAHFLELNPDSNRLQLLLDVAKGLEYLHSAEVVHGDLKAHNIVIDQNHRALLADFGLASITNDPLSINVCTPCKSQGTARWMAPELLDPNIPDNDVPQPTKASDVYAFAMVVIEVFTGNAPFNGYRNEVAVFKMLNGFRPARPTDAPEYGLTDEVWKFVSACWQEKPQKRPTMTEAVQCFTKAISDFSRVSPPLSSAPAHNNEKSGISSSSRNQSPSGSIPSKASSLQNSVGSFIMEHSSPFIQNSGQDGCLSSQKQMTFPEESFESFIRELDAISNKLPPFGQGYTTSAWDDCPDTPSKLIRKDSVLRGHNHRPAQVYITSQPNSGRNRSPRHPLNISTNLPREISRGRPSESTVKTTCRSSRRWPKSLSPATLSSSGSRDGVCSERTKLSEQNSILGPSSNSFSPLPGGQHASTTNNPVSDAPCFDTRSTPLTPLTSTNNTRAEHHLPHFLSEIHNVATIPPHDLTEKSSEMPRAESLSVDQDLEIRLSPNLLLILPSTLPRASVIHDVAPVRGLSAPCAQKTTRPNPILRVTETVPPPATAGFAGQTSLSTRKLDDALERKLEQYLRRCGSGLWTLGSWSQMIGRRRMPAACWPSPVKKKHVVLWAERRRAHDEDNSVRFYRYLIQ